MTRERGIVYKSIEDVPGKEKLVMGVPNHVLIIPDNNRTWAKARGLTVRQGYDVGARRVVEAGATASGIIGLDYLTVNLVSRDNIVKRPATELTDLWDAIGENMLNAGLPDLVKQGVRVRTVGRMDGVPDDIRDGFASLSSQSEGNTGLALTFAIGYDKDVEQRDAHAAAGKAGEDTSNWDRVRNYRYLPAAGLPDIDAVIRTGDEERTSGIFPDAIAQAELHFIRGCYWPEFGQGQFQRAIAEIASHKRKGGA